MLRRSTLHLLFAGATFAAFWNFISNLHHQAPTDWRDYFEPLSFFIRSAVFHYHKLPIHNPWRCGGSDYLINPQTHLFSPIVAFDLFLGSQWACLAPMLLFGFAGAWGMFRLLEHLACTPKTSAVTAVLFVLSSWLGLHFSAGHVVYAEMQLLPWILLFGLRYREKNIQFALMSLLALILLNGAIQALIYAGFVLVCAAVIRWRSREPSGPPLDARYLAKLAGIFLLITAAKTVPVGLSIRGRLPMIDEHWMSARLFFNTFFYPWQDMRLPMPPNTDYMFHEFGCYLGWTATALVILLALTLRGRSRAGVYFGVFVFWLWTATGFGNKINPWNLMHRIPIVNQAHIQSRLLIILFLFFLVLVAKALDQFGRKPAVWSALAALLLVEGAYVRYQSTLLMTESQTPELTPRNVFIQSDRVTETVAEGQLVDHYLKPNLGGSNCNDRSFYASSVIAKGSSGYRGEVYLTDGTGTAEYARFIPGQIDLRYQVSTPSQIAVNTNYLWGWKSEDPRATVISKGFSDLVRVQVPAGQGTVRLNYAPTYLLPSLALFLLGMFAYLWELRRHFR